MKTVGTILGLVSYVQMTSLAIAEPTVPGYQVQTYATVTDPARMSFDPAGNLYLGRDATGSGGTGTQSVKIHRVAAGGSPVSEYGSIAIPDPDVVLFDATGVVSGTPGTVLVGGATGGGGRISGIRPDQTTFTRFSATTTFTNPVGMAFDSTGRFVMADEGTSRILTTTGAAPAILFSVPPRPRYMAIDSLNRIFLSLSDGSIRIHGPDGGLIDADFLSGGLGAELPIAIGPGGPLWGTDLFALSSATGGLFRIDSMGSATLIGSGFTGAASDLGFGPDGMLYVSMFGEDRVLRIIPEPGMLCLTLMGAAATLRRKRD